MFAWVVFEKGRTDAAATMIIQIHFATMDPFSICFASLILECGRLKWDSSLVVGRLFYIACHRHAHSAKW